MDETRAIIYFKTFDEVMNCIDELKDMASRDPKYIVIAKIKPQEDNTFILDLNIIETCLN
jgi:hypothetical protein